jgi:hypothetical protein
MDGPAPAIINAIVNALGVEFNSVPLLPEDILEVMDPSKDLKLDDVSAGASR